jgi:hypothetical protein
MRFSERYGHRSIRQSVQINEMDLALRNSIWNVLYQNLFQHWTDSSDYWTIKGEKFSSALWRDFYKQPVDGMPHYDGISDIKEKYFISQWYEVYDLIEFLLEKVGINEVKMLAHDLNQILEREMSAYRVVGSDIVPMTSTEEIDSVVEAESLKGIFAPVSQHIQAAVTKFSDRTAPDYRNSIKESISAVEAICRLVTGKATFGEALKILEQKGVALHPALNQAFSKLYGYTSDAEGIRHALLDQNVINFEDAKFMLVVCSAFVNLVRARVQV